MTLPKRWGIFNVLQQDSGETLGCQIQTQGTHNRRCLSLGAGQEPIHHGTKHPCGHAKDHTADEADFSESVLTGEACHQGQRAEGQGKKVAGVFCTFTPVEILEAAGFTTVPSAA